MTQLIVPSTGGGGGGLGLHSATHEEGGNDEVTITTAQISDLADVMEPKGAGVVSALIFGD